MMKLSTNAIKTIAYLYNCWSIPLAAACLYIGGSTIYSSSGEAGIRYLPFHFILWGLFQILILWRSRLAIYACAVMQIVAAAVMGWISIGLFAEANFLKAIGFVASAIFFMALAYWPILERRSLKH